MRARRALRHAATVLVRQQPARSSTSCGAPRRRPGRLLGHHLRADRRRRRRLLAVPGRPTIPARRGCFADRFPTPSGRARFHAVGHEPTSPTSATTTTRCTSPPAGCCRTTSRATRRGASPQLRSADARSRSRRCIRRRRGSPASSTAAASRSPRAAGRRAFTVKVTRDIREDTVFVPFHWSGEQSVNRLTNAALDPISRMPEFKVCAVRVAAARKRGSDVTGKRVSSSSATAWPAPAWSKICSPAAAASGSTSPCSATSRTATTTASCCRACWPAPTTPATSSSTRSSWYAQPTA